MRFRPVLLLSFAVLVCLPAFARPTPVPITSSNIGAAASSNPSWFVRAGSKVFFAANDGVHGVQPWITDGTAAGTQMIVSAGSPEFIGVLGSSAIFKTADSTGGPVYWRTDGTAAGTVKLLTIPTGSNSGWYAEAVFADTRFYVLVQLSYSGPVELYVSDGTAAGSRDVGKFPAHLSPTPVGVNGFLYFLGQDASVGPQLWVSDGTVIGTHMVQRGFECPGSSCGLAPVSFLRAGSKAMFLTAGGLWTIGDRGSSIQQIASVANPVLLAYSVTAPRAYFSAKDTLWSTDGTAAGTAAINGVTPLFPAQVLDSGRLVFFESNGGSYDVWTSDGTSAGSFKVGALTAPGSTLVVAATGNKVFLSGKTSTSGTELWLADLDNLSVTLLDDIDSRIGINGPSSGDPGYGVALGSKVLFPATDVRGRELWQSDGTTAGTSLLANIAPDPGGGVISGTVRTAGDGSPLANATVAVCASSVSGCDALFADSAGHYHFDGVIPGTYAVLASGYLYPSKSQNVSVTAGVETSGVDFALTQGGRISGTVTRASTGQPIGAASGTLTVSIFDRTGVRVDLQTAHYTDGTYFSRGLAAGTYYALVSGNYFSNGQPAVNQTYKNHDCAFPSCTWQNGDPISVADGVTTPGVDFSLHAYGTIAGKVRDDAGSPLPRFSVFFMPQGSTNASISVQTDNNGAYVSPPLNPGSYFVLSGDSGFDTKVYPNGTCSSQFNCIPAGGSLVNVAVDGATTGIDFQLAPAKGRIVGTIRDSNGNPFSGVTVEMRDTTGYYISAYGGPVQTDAFGHYDFYNIPDGTYYIKAFDELYPGVDCFDNPCSPAAATPIILTAGHSVRADMQLLSQRTTISGHLLDSVTKSRLASGFVLLFEGSGRALGNGFVNGDSYTMTTIGRSKTYLMFGSAGGYHGAMYPNVRWDCFGGSCTNPPGGTVIPAGTSTNIDISLDRRGSISGTVTDAASGQPVSSVEVLFYWANGNGYATSILTNDKGVYTVFADPGSYVSYTTGSYSYRPQIYNGRPCSASPCDPAHGEVVTLTDGVPTTGIDYHLTALYQYGFIHGHVTDAQTGSPMSDVYISCGSLSARTDANGDYVIGTPTNVFPGLSDGQYTMYAETDDPYFIGLSGGGACEDFYVCRNNGAPVQVTAPNTTTVDFRMIKLHVTSVAPAYGLTTGGTRITVTGANFTPSASVLVGDTAATIVSATSNQIIALTPPGTAGAAHVTVRLSPSLAVTFAQAFTYVPSMTVPETPVIPGTPIKPGHGLP